MKLGFTGSRNGMTQSQRETFLRLLHEKSPSVFVHGDCVGADEQAHKIVEDNLPTVSIVVAPSLNASLRAWCKPRTGVLCEARASIARNRTIAIMCDELIAAPRKRLVPDGGFIPQSGTQQTIEFAQDNGRPVTVINEDGSISQPTLLSE